MNDKIIKRIKSSLEKISSLKVEKNSTVKAEGTKVEKLAKSIEKYGLL